LPNFITELSLVAVEAGRVVGHILFSPMTIETQEGAVPAVALATLAVRPEFQNQAIGSQLVRDGLDRCSGLGHRIVVVVGHPEYYPRFGFSPARARGLEAPFPVPDDAFLALELAPGALEGVAGTVRYPPPFEEV
jgi:putative acetyltransferase